MSSSPEQYSLHGKVAIVTGAGSGISRACAIEFARAGASVACVDLNEAGLSETLALVTQSGGKATTIRCDVSSEAETHAAVETTVKRYGAVHVLLNGAAMADPSGTVVDYDLSRWNKVLGVNLGGAFLMSRWAIPHMIKSGGGSIIHIASQLGSVGAPERVAYCAAKGALINLARAMAIDHAKQNIRVNTLSPGAVETGRMLMRHPTMEEARKALGPRHVLQRLGLPDELARAALFLASDASSFMTGADLLVDGGYNAW